MSNQPNANVSRPPRHSASDNVPTMPYGGSNMPSPMEKILTAAIRRIRWQDGVKLVPRAIIGGLLVGLLLFVTSRFYPFVDRTTMLWVTGALVALGIVGTVGYLSLRSYSVAWVARQLDTRLNLDERLSTAVELSQSAQPVLTEIREAQLNDTLALLKDFDPVKVLPLRVDKCWFAAIAFLVGAIGAAYLLPSTAEQAWQQEAQNQAVAAEQAARLEEIQAKILDDAILMDALKEQEEIPDVAALVEALQENDILSEELLATLAEAEGSLADLQDVAERQNRLLNELAANLSQQGISGELTTALQQGDLTSASQFLENMAESITTASEETQRQLADALSRVAEAAREVGDQTLANAFSQAAASLQESLSAQSASNQSSALNTANSPASQNATQAALQQAADVLSEANQSLANQEAIDQAIANIQAARQQLAQAANQDGVQSSSQGSGQGRSQVNSQGNGQGDQEVSQGQGIQGGSGSSGESNGSALGMGPAQEMITNGSQGATGQQLGEPNISYPSIFLGGEQGPVVDVDGQGGEGGVPVADVPINPNQPTAPALVPYNQVYGEYATAANQALDDAYIPLGMKDAVRTYFGSLDPGAGSNN